jgi:hypothetical protein
MPGMAPFTAFRVTRDSYSTPYFLFSSTIS